MESTFEVDFILLVNKIISLSFTQCCFSNLFVMEIKNNILLSIFSAVLLVMLSSCETKETAPLEKQFPIVLTNKDSIRLEMQQVLEKEFAAWYPLSLDTVYGGFFSDMNDKWELDGAQNKMIVTQARHVWSTANVYLHFKRDSAILAIAKHGFEFLKNKMWDKAYGGFYDLVDREGKPIPENGEMIKKAYGNSFAIYGLAKYYEASGNKEALRLAQETFYWMERHSYDSQYGGYFQFMKQDGAPFTDGYKGTPPKDYDSMIHILECFTELYHVLKDPLVKERLHSMLILVRDTLTSEKGFLKLYFDRKWNHIPNENNFFLDHISFGHDVETAYLLLEASEALELKNDTVTLRVAKKMVDHALANGFDNENGGIYDGGYYYNEKNEITITKNTKEWWSQVEAFNAFLLMSELFPNDEHHYYEKFCKQWNYCMNFLIDHEHGGWYWSGIDIEPDKKYSPKSSIWKCNYHTSRSLINCISKLEK